AFGRVETDRESRDQRRTIDLARKGRTDTPKSGRGSSNPQRRRFGIGYGSRTAILGDGCYLGPICSASVSSMRYSGRWVTASSSLILATLPLKQPPLETTSESVLMLPVTRPVAAISTLPVAVMLPS